MISLSDNNQHFDPIEPFSHNFLIGNYLISSLSKFPQKKLCWALKRKNSKGFLIIVEKSLKDSNFNQNYEYLKNILTSNIIKNKLNLIRKLEKLDSFCILEFTKSKFKPYVMLTYNSLKVKPYYKGNFLILIIDKNGTIKLKTPISNNFEIGDEYKLNTNDTILMATKEIFQTLGTMEISNAIRSKNLNTSYTKLTLLIQANTQKEPPHGQFILYRTEKDQIID